MVTIVLIEVVIFIMVFGPHPRMENLGLVGQGVRVFKDIRESIRPLTCLDNYFRYLQRPLWKCIPGVGVKGMIFSIGVRVQRTEEGAGSTDRLNIVANMPLIFINIINTDCIPTCTRQHGKHFSYVTHSVFTAVLGHWYCLIQGFSTWMRWTLGQRRLCVGVVLCTVGYLVVSLTLTH